MNYFPNLERTNNESTTMDKVNYLFLPKSENNTITEVRSFKYGHELDKYAPKID